MIEFACPHCNHRIAVPDKAAGRAGVCPACNSRVVVPGAQGVAAQTGPAPATGSPAARKPCPFCGQMIAATAKKCRFCGEFLEAAPTRQAVAAAGTGRHGAVSGNTGRHGAVSGNTGRHGAVKGDTARHRAVSQPKPPASGGVNVGAIVAVVVALAVVGLIGFFMLTSISSRPQPTGGATAWPVSELMEMAKRGDAEAQNALGVCYADGKGVAKNSREAARWFEKAAKQGDREAQYNLAMAYLPGKGVPKDVAKAREWLRRAAAQGHAEAKRELDAFEDLRRKANDGDVDAIRALAEGGDAEMQYKYAVALVKLGKEDREAMTWVRKAATQGNVDAEILLGVHCTDMGNLREGAEWLRKAAEQGDDVAKHKLNQLVAKAIQTIRENGRDIDALHVLAEAGIVDAQCVLGVCYYEGKGVEQDQREAVKWFKKAAEKGNADAQANLGSCYENGHGVSKDHGTAVKWYKKAAEQGNANAQFRLGFCYFVGEGVTSDANESLKWLRKAAQQGHAGAREMLSKIANER